MYQIAVGLLLGQGIILLGATVLAILMCLGAECTWDWDYVFRPSTLCPPDPPLWHNPVNPEGYANRFYPSSQPDFAG